MPELPEVEVVRRGLEPTARGSVVRQVLVLEPRSLKRHSGPLDDFVDQLTGATLDRPVRRGKFLWIPFVDRDGGADRALLCHLGMSGQMLIGQHPDQFGRLARILIELDVPGREPLWWGFVDQRIFGSLAIDQLVTDQPGVPSGTGSVDDRIPRQVRHIGRDLLDPALDEAQLIRRMRQRSSGIKRVLLDQNLQSGVGNIYADEALWREKIHYDQPADRLTAARLRGLLSSVREVFTQALDEGGTSFDWQYVNVNGQSGYFSRSLNAYGQDGQACGRCGRIIVREPFMNRSSFRCPKCQPKPRKKVG